MSSPLQPPARDVPFQPSQAAINDPLPGCECPDVASSPRYHGGATDRCPRPAADHSPVVTSPALCLPCLHGCDLDHLGATP
jgi:hypothetical protein